MLAKNTSTGSDVDRSRPGFLPSRRSGLDRLASRGEPYALDSPAVSLDCRLVLSNDRVRLPPVLCANLETGAM